MTDLVHSIDSMLEGRRLRQVEAARAWLRPVPGERFVPSVVAVAVMLAYGWKPDLFGGHAVVAMLVMTGALLGLEVVFLKRRVDGLVKLLELGAVPPRGTVDLRPDPVPGSMEVAAAGFQGAEHA